MSLGLRFPRTALVFTSAPPVLGASALMTSGSPNGPALTPLGHASQPGTRQSTQVTGSLFLTSRGTATGCFFQAIGREALQASLSGRPRALTLMTTSVGKRE